MDTRMIVDPQREMNKEIVDPAIVQNLQAALALHFPGYDWSAVRDSLNQVLREKRMNRGCLH